jgi:hypothetical protein
MARVRLLASLLNCTMPGRPEIYILVLAHEVFLELLLYFAQCRCPCPPRDPFTQRSMTDSVMWITWTYLQLHMNGRHAPSLSNSDDGLTGGNNEACDKKLSIDVDEYSENNRYSTHWPLKNGKSIVYQEKKTHSHNFNCLGILFDILYAWDVNAVSRKWPSTERTHWFDSWQGFCGFFRPWRKQLQFI